jgi:hypothetical protein
MDMKSSEENGLEAGDLARRSLSSVTAAYRITILTALTGTFVLGCSNDPLSEQNMNTLDAAAETRARLPIETWSTYEQDGVQSPVVDPVRALATRQARRPGRCAQVCLDSFNGCIESAKNEADRWACSNSFGWCLADCAQPRDQRVVTLAGEIGSLETVDAPAKLTSTSLTNACYMGCNPLTGGGGTAYCRRACDDRTAWCIRVGQWGECFLP